MPEPVRDQRDITTRIIKRQSRTRTLRHRHALAETGAALERKPIDLAELLRTLDGTTDPYRNCRR